MTWLLLLVILDASGHREQMAPASADWWTCRRTELRVSAGYADRYGGQDIVGAACVRREPVATAYCPRWRKGCLA